jgi:hypothetical protein
MASIVALIALASCSSVATKEASVTTESQTGKYAKYEGRLLRRPGTSSEDSKIYLVRDGKKRWVTSPQWLEAHKSEFKGDVIILSPQELEDIPIGDPLQ